LEEKVERAAAYYGDKYGRKPELCFVNPEMLSAEKTINSIVVQTAASIQPNYFWLGNPA
jgi:hypothetical protein